MVKGKENVCLQKGTEEVGRGCLKEGIAGEYERSLIQETNGENGKEAFNSKSG